MTESEIPRDITQQNTLPLNILTLRGATLFQAYLERYDLHPLDVSIASGVRYLTIWNIQHGTPISSRHAAQVRLGLLRLTSIPFTAPIATQPDTERENKLRRIDLTKCRIMIRRI